MGLDSTEELLQAEEEAARSQGSPLARQGSSRSTFSRTFRGLLRLDGEDPEKQAKGIYNRTRVSVAVEALLLCPPPPTESSSSQKGRQAFSVIDNFKRQRSLTAPGADSTGSLTTKDLHSSAPVGLGIMHAGFDRWWSQAEFLGEVLQRGIFFHSFPEVIAEYLIASCDNPESQALALGFIQKITNTSNLAALGEFTLVKVFEGNGVASLSAGSSAFGLVSGLGEVNLQTSKQLFSSCTGSEDPQPADWNGTVTTEKVLGRRIKHIVCGVYHYAALTDSEELIAWGSNCAAGTERVMGQLGHNASKFSPPALISQLSGKPLLVGCGLAHTVIVDRKSVV